MSRIRISGLRAGKLEALLEVDSRTLVDLAVKGEATLHVKDERESCDFEPVHPEAIVQARLDSICQTVGGEHFSDDDGPELEGTDARAAKVPSSIAGPDKPKARNNTHWADIRHEILSAALQLISENGREYFKGRDVRSINADTLAGEIDNQRHRWPRLKAEEHGAARGNILKTIHDALAHPDKAAR